MMIDSEKLIRKIRDLRKTAWFNENTLGSYAVRLDAMETVVQLIRLEEESERLNKK